MLACHGGAHGDPLGAVLGNGFDTVHAMLLGTLQLKALLVFPIAEARRERALHRVRRPGASSRRLCSTARRSAARQGEALALVFPGLAPPGALALVGMAGVLAGTTHAAVSSVLIVFEMTGDYGVILPLMLSAAIAAATSPAIEPESPLHRAAPPPRRAPPRSSRSPTGSAAPRSRRSSSRTPSAPRHAAVRSDAEEAPVPAAGHDLYVTTVENGLLGVIQLDALKGTISDQAHLGMIVAADVVDPSCSPSPRR